MSLIIGFAGRKQSGKTTCSEFIKEYYNYKMYNKLLDSVKIKYLAKIYNFADPLKKDICINILGLTYDQCYGTDEQKNTITDIEWEDKKLTAREVMQFVGTDIFRKMKNNIWADATIAKIKKEKPNLAIIADCRFPNEVDAIKNAGGIVIKLTRNPFDSDHASETALDPDNYDQSNFDFVLDNKNLSIEDQNIQLNQFLQDKGIPKL